jgi:hypothetical protein
MENTTKTTETNAAPAKRPHQFNPRLAYAKTAWECAIAHHESPTEIASCEAYLHQVEEIEGERA